MGLCDWLRQPFEAYVRARLSAAASHLDAPVPRVALLGPGFAGKSTFLGRIGKMPNVTAPALAHVDDCLVLWVDQRLGFGPVRWIAAPGAQFLGAGRRAVLQQARVILFVADAQPARADANVASAEEVPSLWRAVHGEQPLPPIVLCVNKIDLGPAEPVVAALTPILRPAATHAVCAATGKDVHLAARDTIKIGMIVEILAQGVSTK